ncbi:hypothetical protein I552_0641 [Mycobacterium xenopi 3993]|nr:hypothetical protein I552_0641 [Mycobacterium xenopi 3993]
MAAQELLPAQPSDLTAILADPDEFAALLRPRWDPAPASELVRYLRENLDPGRIDWWHKVIDQVIQERIAVPILAGTPQYPAGWRGVGMRRRCCLPRRRSRPGPRWPSWAAVTPCQSWRRLPGNWRLRWRPLAWSWCRDSRPVSTLPPTAAHWRPAGRQWR